MKKVFVFLFVLIFVSCVNGFLSDVFALENEDLDERLQGAEQLQKEGANQEALEQYEALLSHTPDDGARVQIVRKIVALEFQLNGRDEALAVLEKELDRLAPGHWLIEALLDQTEELFSGPEQQRDLVSYYKERHVARPGDLVLLKRLVALTLQQGDLDEAKKLLIDPIDQFPSNVELRRLFIEVLLRQKNFQLADHQYQELVRLAPNDPEIRIAWGVFVLQQGNEEPTARSRALEIWSRLLDGKENDSVRRKLFAQLLSQYGFWREAEENYRKAIELEPRDPSLYESLARVFQRQGKKEEVRQILMERVSELSATPGEPLATGKVFLDLHFWEDGSLLLMQAAEDRANDLSFLLSILNHLVDSLDSKYRSEQAAMCARIESLLTRAAPLVRHDREREDLIVSEIRYLKQTGQLALPLERSLDPEGGTVLFERIATLAEEEGVLSLAIQYRERLEIANPSRENRWKLFSLYKKSGDQKKTDCFYCESLLAKEETEIVRNEFDLQMARENYRLAERVFERLATRALPSWEILYREGELAWRLGDQEKALEIFNQLCSPVRDLSEAVQGATEPVRSEEALAFSIMSCRGVTLLPRDCFKGVPLPESLLLTETLFRENLKGAVSSKKKIKPQFVPKNAGEAVVAGFFWEILIREKNSKGKSNIDLRSHLNELRKKIAVDRDIIERGAKGRIARYEQTRRELFFEGGLSAWDSILGTSYSLTRDELQDRALSFGFLSSFDNEESLAFRDLCYRYLMNSLVGTEVNAYLRGVDLDSAMMRYCPEPKPEIKKSELEILPEKKIVGAPESLSARLQWLVSWLENEIEQLGPKRYSSNYQKISFDVYEQDGLVMNMPAPVFSTKFRVCDYYFIKKALAQVEEPDLQSRFENCIDRLTRHCADLDLNGAFVAVTAPGILLNATNNYYLRFSPYLIFPNEYKSLDDALFWLDRLFLAWEQKGVVHAHASKTLDELFYCYLLYSDNNIHEWIGESRDHHLIREGFCASPIFESRLKSSRVIDVKEWRLLKNSLVRIEDLLKQYARYRIRLNRIFLAEGMKLSEVPASRFLGILDEMFRRLDLVMASTARGSGVTQEQLLFSSRDQFRKIIKENRMDFRDISLMERSP